MKSLRLWERFFISNGGAGARVPKTSSHPWRLMSFVLISGAVVILGACEDRDTTTTEVRPRPRASRSVGKRPASIRRAEAPFATLSSSAPSAAGFFFDETGTLVVRVRDSADFLAANASVAQLVAARAIGTDYRWKGQVKVQPADFTFYELAGWRDSVFEHVLGRFRELKSLDLNEKENRVVVGVEPGALDAMRRQLPEVLASYGIDSNAVSLVARSGALSEARSLGGFVGGNVITNHADTLIGGVAQVAVSPGGYILSTIGVVLNYGGVRSVLTCSHCTKTAYSPDSDTLYQPDIPYGYESADPGTSTCGSWPFTFSCRSSDASIIRLFSGDTSEIGLIARTTYGSYFNAGSLTWDTDRPYFIITGTSPSVSTGTVVQKVGRATGWTYGSVTATCVDVTNNDNGGIKVLCNTETDYYSSGGDSGGPVFVWDGVNVASFAGIHDLHDGSHKYFSPLTQINYDFTSSMSIARTTSLSAPSISGSVSSSHPLISWASISGATEYELSRSWCVYDGLSPSCASGSNGWEYVGKVYSTSDVDAEMTVSSYNGGSVPGIGNYGWVGYKLSATNKRDVSGISNEIYFVLSP